MFKKWKIKYHILWGYFIPVFIIAVVAGYTYWGYHIADEASWYVEEHNKVLELDRDLQDVILNNEIAFLHFTLTGKDEFLNSLLLRRRIFHEIINKLKILLDKHPSKLAKVEEIEKWVRNKVHSFHDQDRKSVV